jgi:hypothetical protein
MSRRRRYSTRTVADDGRIVPWLAAWGPLSYTPEDPPPRDYFFQYGWVLPGIFNPPDAKRCHFYFGASVKDHADELFSFWRNAREGRAVRVACYFGTARGGAGVTAPVAVYLARDFRGRDGYLLMQHGSYQFVAGDGLAGELWRVTHQGFTLARWVAEAKFGPHFVKCKTPVGNVRFTTFFSGEQEARVIDPDRVEFTESVGCRVERRVVGA